VIQKGLQNMGLGFERIQRIPLQGFPDCDIEIKEVYNAYPRSTHSL
jgi:hypothetical protein